MSSADRNPLKVDDEASLDGQSCIRGARALIELVAQQVGNEDSDLHANPDHARDCLYGINRLLERAELLVASG